MPYKVLTKINGVEIKGFEASIVFEGHIDKPETRTIKPVKAMDKNYYYFIIDNRPVKAHNTDVMTIEQINIDD